MKHQKTIIISIIVLAILAIYLNRSYAYIYNYVSQKNLTSPTTEQSYTFGNKQNQKTITYIALGDSLTTGIGATNYQKTYPYLLATSLAKNNATSTIKLTNLAQPGAKTADIINSQLPGIINPKPNIVTLLIGANDIHGFVSAKDFQTNIETIIGTLKKTNAKIIIINIPYIGARTLVLPPYNIYFDLKTKQFNKIMANIATQENVKYIDIYTPTKSLLNNSAVYSSDKFHPSEGVYLTWSQIIYANSN